MRSIGIVITLVIGGWVVATGSGCASSGHDHAPPVTDRLEPYECGTVTRLHTYQGIFLASQPQPADFEQANKGGVRTVINLRHKSEITGFDERKVVEGLGMVYENVPWNGPDELTDEVLDRTRGLLKSAEGPILLHCSSANRVGAVWMAYRVLDTGLGADDAAGEAKVVGLKSPAYERIVRSYIERHSR